MISFLYWNPDRAIFSFDLPFLGRPILWYGFFFSLGFFVAYQVFLHLLKKELLPKQLAEKVLCYVIVGTLIGARLGDILFYQDWRIVLLHPLSIFQIWEGGLASHGGAMGIFAALILFYFRLKPSFSFAKLLDLVVIPVCLAAFFIRVGNFFNQEILGTPSQVPWAVIFGNPADGGGIFPRHPVQLYEGLVYLSLFFPLFFLRKKFKEGQVSGLFFICVFGTRFVLEFFKEEQSSYLDNSSFLSMGQILSIPFIFLGVWLFLRHSNKLFNSLGVKRS